MNKNDKGKKHGKKICTNNVKKNESKNNWDWESTLKPPNKRQEHNPGFILGKNRAVIK